MKIIIDAYGGDNAPNEIIKGTALALQKEEGFTAVLTGKKEVINVQLDNYAIDKSRVEVVDARDVITNNDVPTEAIRTKKESSLVAAFDYLNNDDDAAALISAGSTGAVLTGAILLTRRIRGVNRPALAPLLPMMSSDGQVMLIDCGANSDCKAANLVQFAKMGSIYMQAINNVESPRIGLLSNGTEDKKGDELHKETFSLLKEQPLNFIGNIEGRDIISGDYDVVVADGFSGNIALKACEGTALGMFGLIKSGIENGGFRAKLGYLLLKPVLKSIKKKMDYNDNGGAILLGLKKIVIKSHGSSKAASICASILQAKNMAERNVVDKIEAML